MSERSPVLPRTCRQNAAPNKSVRLRALAFPCRDCSFYLFLQREPFVYLRNTSIRWHSLSQFFCGKRLRCLHAALPESRFYSSLYAETSMISRHGSASCIPPPSIRWFVCSCLGKAFMRRYDDRFCLLSSGSKQAWQPKKRGTSLCLPPLMSGLNFLICFSANTNSGVILTEQVLQCHR